MARSNATTKNCFSAATGLSDADARKLDAAADRYGTGDITADYRSAVADMVATLEGQRDAIQGAMEVVVAPALAQPEVKVALNQDAIGPGAAEAAAVNRDVTGPSIPNVAINADVLSEVVLKAATNPDMAGMETQIPAGVVFTDGAQAAGWLAANSKSEFVRDLMARLAPHLKGVPVHLLNVGDPAPVEVLNELNKKARGITAFDPSAVQGNPAVQVYIRSSDGNSETVWAHELFHAATMVRLQNGGDVVTRKIKTLARMVGLSLGTDRGAWPINNPTTRNAHEFFKSHFLGAGKLGDPDEFLAYAMTSPAFQGIMKKLDPNGQWLQEYKPEKTQGVPQRTLWHRFVDAILGLFNLPRKHADAIEKIVQLNSEIEARNATEGEHATLRNSLDRLLGELLSSPTPAAQGLPAAPVLRPSSTEGLTRAKPQTMQQFSDKLPGRVADLWDSFKTTVDEVSVKAMFTQDLIDLASKVLPSAAKYMRAMSDIQIERGRAERVVADVVEDFRALPAHERGMGDKSVNAFIKKSTMTGKWAFAPDWVPGAKVDPDLKADFEAALSPKAQDLVKRVFRRGHESLVEMQTAAIANADSEYNALIAEATKAGDTKEVTKLTSAKAKSLKDFQGLLAIHKGTPYAPLKRFGNYVVMAVSQQYKAASEAGDAKAMQEMQRNGDHYHIEFTDTNREARERTRILESAFPGGFVGKMEKGDDGLMMGGRDMLGAFGRLRKVMADSVVDNPNVDKATGKRIDDMMRQLYLTLLSETSARKGEIHRKNVAGANNDMMRAFATQGRATAHFIAGLKTSGKVDDHLAGMRTETKALNSGREERTRYYNEIVRRHSLGLEYKPSPMVDQMMAGTSAMMLLTNPSYHLMNALQPGMMTIPLLAGRHGYAKSWAALTRAYSELGPILKAREFTEKSYAALPADVRQAIEDLANMGKIDIMMDADLGRVESASDNAVKRPFVVASEWLKGLSQDVESMNRLSSAIAAYRLEKGQPGATHQSAVDYASKVIYETHGDYSGFNAPRFMRSGIGRLATQFKKFQLIQLSMFARLASRSWRNDPSLTLAQNAEAKVAARYALTYTLSHLLAMGGVMGLPGFAAIAWVVGKVWPGDDEPDDPEATLRRAIGNEALADFLLQGAPTLGGVNVSGRIGAGGMLSVLPYTDVEFSRKSYPEMVTAAMGPFIGGVLPRAVGGIELMTKGELWKGAEALLPNGFGNALKAVRLADEGVTKGNGDTLMAANDLHALAILGQAFGLPGTPISDRTTQNSSQYKAEQFYKDRTGELKQRYTKAAKSNDADTLRDLRTEWTNTQAARRDLGFKSSPLSDLLKSPQEQRKREAATANGVQFNKGNKGFVEALQ